MKNNFSNYLTHQSKKIAWIRFDWLDGSKPPRTSDKKKYVCLNAFGEMQVCVWDGICEEWIYFQGSKLTDDQIHAAALAVSAAAHDVILKNLKKTKIDLEAITEEIYEMALECRHQSISYFDYVEWFMELPDSPVIDEITVEDGEEVQAAIFEQELMLFEYIEEAVKKYVSAKSKIVKANKDAP